MNKHRSSTTACSDAYNAQLNLPISSVPRTLVLNPKTLVAPPSIDTMDVEMVQPCGAGTTPPEQTNYGEFDNYMDSGSAMQLDSESDAEEPPESDAGHPPINVDGWRGFPEDPTEPDDSSDVITEVYPGAGRVQEQTSRAGFDDARQEQERKAKGNIFYPFSGETEWELVAWLHHSGVSLSDVDKFLKLRYVSSLR